jgi:3-methyladenine DNA glycosylase AlkD
MAAKRKRKAPSPSERAASAPEVIATLEGMANEKVRDGMARFAILSDHALGISVGALRQLGKTLGKSHELAMSI